MSVIALARSFGLLALSVAPASATDWYVDGVSGSDSNGGTSPTDAWKSITWALANTPTSGVQRILIAPAGYGHTTGEMFPLQLRPGVELMGLPGPTRPVVGQPPASVVSACVELRTLSTDVLAPGAQIRIENLDFARGFRGLQVVHGAPGALAVRVRNCDLFDLNFGLDIQTSGAATAAVELERVDYVGGSQVGVGLDMSSSGPLSTLLARECSTLAGRDGVRLEGALDARFERCRFEGPTMRCVYLSQLSSTFMRTSFESCLLVDSNNDGIRWLGGPGGTVQLARCTVANNGGYGINTDNIAFTLADVDVEQCIFANNLGDLVIPLGVSIRDSLIRSGELNGVNGNFAADPLFVDPAQSDWSLRWNSPAIDRVADSNVALLLDFSARTRGVDGDLDLLERSDLGAVEFRPLAAPLTARIGRPLRIGSWGPQGAASTIYWARSAPVGPTATPFGQFALPAGSLQVFTVTTTGAAAPTLIQRAIPDIAQLVGQTYSFQALVDSPAAPLGRAYTNVAPVTFEF